jgi:hypothetical protein
MKMEYVFHVLASRIRIRFSPYDRVGGYFMLIVTL